MVLWYQAGNWSMNQGLRGLPDWPRTRLRVEWSRLLKSAVRRSEGPKVRLTCLTVVASPLWGWGPVPVGTADDGSDEGRDGEDGVFDVYGVGLAVGPVGEVVRGRGLR